MIQIDDILVSEDLGDQFFQCDIAKCKGACCSEGDSGAPLEEDEIIILQEILETIRPFLTPKGLATIAKKGTSVFEKGQNRTPLNEDGTCAYAIYDKAGRVQCGIEKAFDAGATDFKKPVSCHLFPVRVSKLRFHEALNYDKWEICNPACKLGRKNNLPLFRFVKEALIRRFGNSFYEKLEEAFWHAE